MTVVTPGDAKFPVRPWTWIEGNRIVYSAALGGDSWDLWEVALAPDTWVASTEPRRLTTGADLQAHASIVGARLVFSSLTQTINVWSLPLDAKEGRVVGPARRVTATSALQWWPSVSEDGRRLVFRGDKGGLWIRELDTDREVLLVSSQRPVRGFITADGSRVAFMVLGQERGNLCGAVDGWCARKTLRGLRRQLLGRLVERQNATAPRSWESQRGFRPRSPIGREEACASPSAKPPLERAILPGRSLD